MEESKAKLNEALKNPYFYGVTVVLRLGLVVGFLYFFLVALAIMGDGFKAVGGKDSGSLFSFVNNPIAGLMVGVLATVLVQSSSTTTSVVVTAVGADALTVQTGVPIIMGANIGTSVTNTIVSLGFANDHTNYERAFSGATVHDMFNFLGVALFLPIDIIWNAINGGNGGLFFAFTDLILAEETEGNDDLVTTLPIKEAVADISKAIIDINKDIIADYAQGRPDTSICGTTDAVGEVIDYYKMIEKKACGDPLIPHPAMAAGYGAYSFDEEGLIECNCKSVFNESMFVTLSAAAKDSSLLPSGTEYTGFATMAKALAGDPSDDKDPSCKGGKFKFDFCKEYDNADLALDFGAGFNSTTYQTRVLESVQFFFDNTRSVKGGGLFENGLDDVAIGVVSLIISLLILIVCLVGIVKVMQSLVQGPAEKYVIRALNYNFRGGGLLAILVGAGLTLLVQSSSITTSILTPMVAIGTLSLENMFPFTIGANLGTTGTGLIAGLADGGRNAIQIALCHTFFNIFNTLVWYPAEPMRKVPINAALFLGTMAAAYRLFPVIYILIVFVVYPLFFLAMSSLLGSGGAGEIVGGVILLLLFLGSHGFFLYWYHRMDGKQKIRDTVDEKAKANKGGPVTLEAVGKETI